VPATKAAPRERASEASYVPGLASSGRCQRDVTVGPAPGLRARWSRSPLPTLFITATPIPACESMTEIELVTEGADTGAGTGAESHGALDGCADDPGQDGRGLAEGVRRRVVLARLELTTVEQPPDPAARQHFPPTVGVATAKSGLPDDEPGRSAGTPPLAREWPVAN
jgi:hypothetical protein